MYRYKCDYYVTSRRSLWQRAPLLWGCSSAGPESACSAAPLARAPTAAQQMSPLTTAVDDKSRTITSTTCTSHFWVDCLDRNVMISQPCILTVKSRTVWQEYNLVSHCPVRAHLQYLTTVSDLQLELVINGKCGGTNGVLAVAKP